VRKAALVAVMAVVVLACGSMQAQKIQFSVHNDAPVHGVWIMRPWIGIHDGGFQTFTIGQPASSAVQHIAEDGVTGDAANVLPPPNTCGGLAGVYGPAAPCMFDVFNSYANHGPQATIGNPTPPEGGGVAIFTNSTVSTTFQLNHNDARQQFLSYLVMIIPSNDAFWGTDSASAIRLFKNGRFNNGKGAITLHISGSDILDAGTETNDEGTIVPGDTAFLNQAVNGTGSHPDAGDPNVHQHPGFIAGGPILTGTNPFGATFGNADFAHNGLPVATVTISVVPGSVDPAIALLSTLDWRTAQSLNAKLQNAKKALDGGNFDSGCGMLGAVTNEVNAQSGKSLTSAQANALLGALGDAANWNGCQ